MSRSIEVLSVGQALVDLAATLPHDHFEALRLPQGEFALVTPEAQDEVLSYLAREGIEIAQGTGGSAANSALAAAALGGTIGIATRVGTDSFGAFFRDTLEAAGIDTSATIAEGPTGRCVIVVGPTGARTMRTALGVAGHFGPEDLLGARLQSASWVLLEAYLLNCGGSGRDAVLRALEAVKSGAEPGYAAFSLSDTFLVGRYRKEIETALGGCDLVLANEHEARAFSGSDSIERSLDALLRYSPSAVVTAGGAGAYIGTRDVRLHVPAARCEVVDTTGAGDAFAGALLLGLSRGVPIERAVAAANFVAARVVERIGTQVPSGTREAWEALLA